MKAEKITKQGERTPIAIRFTHLDDEISLTQINPSAKAVLIPEFSAVAYNCESFNQTEIKAWKLKTPEVVEELKANHYAEVWRSLDGANRKRKEVWYFSRIPKGAKCLEHFIELYLRAEVQHALSLSRTAKPSESFTKYLNGEDKNIDPRSQAIQVTLRMLRETYPSTAKLGLGQSLGIDMVRLTGKAMTTLNLSDPKTVIELSEAAATHERRKKRKSVYDSADWFISNPQTWPELCRLQPDEIASRLEAVTKIKLSPGAIQQRISRLGLTTALKRGKK